MTDNLKISGEAKEVDIDSIEGNPWNPNVQSTFKFEQTKKVIAEFGFMDPCTVRSGKPRGKLFKKMQIIDGEHRWKAAKDLGLKSILILDVGRMSDSKSKVLTDIMNNLGGENDPLKWVEMVQSIQEQDEDLLQYLPYQEDELAAMLESTSVDWDSFGTGDPGQESGGLYRKFSVSVSNDTMERVKKLMRKIKAEKGIDDDALAFEVILDGFEAHRAQ